VAGVEGWVFPKRVAGSYVWLKREGNCLDILAAKDFASCYGVNLAFARGVRGAQGRVAKFWVRRLTIAGEGGLGVNLAPATGVRGAQGRVAKFWVRRLTIAGEAGLGWRDGR